MTNSNKDGSLMIQEDHPVFAGHFPDNPIVPGVIILDRVLEYAQLKESGINGIISAKFLSPLLPNQLCSIELSAAKTGIAFKVIHESNIVANGVLGALSPAPVNSDILNNGR